MALDSDGTNIVSSVSDLAPDASYLEHKHISTLPTFMSVEQSTTHTSEWNDAVRNQLAGTSQSQVQNAFEMIRTEQVDAVRTSANTEVADRISLTGGKRKVPDNFVNAAAKRNARVARMNVVNQTRLGRKMVEPSATKPHGYNKPRRNSVRALEESPRVKKNLKKSIEDPSLELDESTTKPDLGLSAGDDGGEYHGGEVSVPTNLSDIRAVQALMAAAQDDREKSRASLAVEGPRGAKSLPTEEEAANILMQMHKDDADLVVAQTHAIMEQYADLFLLKKQSIKKSRKSIRKKPKPAQILEKLYTTRTARSLTRHASATLQPSISIKRENSESSPSSRDGRAVDQT